MAGAFTAVDLSQLPFPNAVRQIDFEAIVAEMKADLIARDPTFTALLESDPAMKIIEACAYREMLVRQANNEAIKAVTLAYAAGADLDQIAARYNVERLLVSPGDPNAIPPVDPVYEDDESLRRRVQLSFEGFSTAGPEGAYIFHALSADADVLDASVDSPDPGEVVVAVLSRSGSGEAGSDLLAAVEAALNEMEVRPLTDQVTVESAEIEPYTIEATIYTFNGPSSDVVMAAAQAAAEKFAADSRRLGRDITLSAIYSAMHQPGVQRVELTAPSADIVMGWNQAPYCTSIDLTFGGTDE